MPWKSFIPSGVGARSSEVSRLVSPRDSRGSGHDWRRVNAVNNASNGALKAVNVARHIYGGIPDTVLPAMLMHPFKLYKLPYSLRSSYPTYSGTDHPEWLWRTFRVRGGYNYTASVSGSAATGTDKLHDYPDWNIFLSLPDGTAITGQTEITVPDSVGKYWFYFDTISGAVKHGYDHGAYTPSLADISGGEDLSASTTWPSYPNLDDNIVLIAYVDTLTLVSNPWAIVNQILRTHIVPPNCPP